MTEEVCVKIEQITRDQKDNSLWHELRFGRITASNIYEASRCETAEGSLVHRVIGASKVYDTIYMERGRRLEQEVIHEIEKKLSLQIKNCGLFLLPSLPVLGASPDGVGSDFVVEIKCPSSLKTVENYLPKGIISNKCKAQIHLQMLAAGKKKGLFCVADPKFEENKLFSYVWILYECEFMDQIIEKATNYWEENVYPLLLKSIVK